MSSKCRTGAVRRRSRARIGLASILAVVVGLSACATLRVGSDYDRTASFSGYHSFTWVPRENHGTNNPLIAERAREAILARLQQKGYVYVSDGAQADFAVDFTIGARQRLDVHTYPAPYAGPWWWYGRGWWGYPYWGSGIDVHAYREGELAIDVFDAKSHRPVWHGWARKPLTREDMQHSRSAIGTAVDAILAKFPPA